MVQCVLCLEVLLSLTWDFPTKLLFYTQIYRSVPQIRPPFATLALVQNVGGGGGGLYAGCDNFSRNYTLPFDKA